ncbi:unnamed protein product [Allacma fusca]|uniref:Uncharacterized protein n=1 Tax=Allacma fusca TaxID=39272 RepID=A0A8J2P7V0_9HEXA|nr:unnamed protein product [Allacma fusca]
MIELVKSGIFCKAAAVNKNCTRTNIPRTLNCVCDAADFFIRETGVAGGLESSAASTWGSNLPSVYSHSRETLISVPVDMYAWKEKNSRKYSLTIS